MKLEQQVVSLELAQKMKELGFKQESYFSWIVSKSNKDEDIIQLRKTDIGIHNNPLYKMYHAYTVAELGEMFADKGICVFSGFGLDGSTYKWFCTQMSMPEFEPWTERWQEADTEADARAKMLIYLVENKIITI